MAQQKVKNRDALSLTFFYSLDDTLSPIIITEAHLQRRPQKGKRQAVQGNDVAENQESQRTYVVRARTHFTAKADSTRELFLPYRPLHSPLQPRQIKRSYWQPYFPTLSPLREMPGEKKKQNRWMMVVERYKLPAIR